MTGVRGGTASKLENGSLRRAEPARASDLPDHWDGGSAWSGHLEFIAVLKYEVVQGVRDALAGRGEPGDALVQTSGRVNVREVARPRASESSCLGTTDDRSGDSKHAGCPECANGLKGGRGRLCCVR